MNNFERCLKILQESPQIVLPLNSTYNEKYVNDYYQNNKSKFKPTNTEYLLKSGDIHNGYYMFVRNNKVDYFAKYEAINNILNKKMLKQVLVERFGIDYKSVGIPKKVFFDYLLPTFGGIASDKEQTYDGKRFWEGAIHDAIDDVKYSVYVIDKRHSPNKTTKIESQEQFDSIVNDVWGNKYFFQYILLSITLN